MIQVCIAVLALLALTMMSLRANRRFSQERRLPMQWSLSGSVNWTAPRALALAFTPVFAAITLAASIVATITIGPRPGQEGDVVPAILAVSLCFVGAHALHLWLIGRWVQTGGR
ncbi:hypothetical protein BH09PSE4_BH09PSE4_12920 [soil metagenome]